MQHEATYVLQRLLCVLSHRVIAHVHQLDPGSLAFFHGPSWKALWQLKYLLVPMIAMYRKQTKFNKVPFNVDWLKGTYKFSSSNADLAALACQAIAARKALGEQAALLAMVKTAEQRLWMQATGDLSHY